MQYHKGVNGLRLWVHKPTRDGYTTISITEPLLSKLMRLAHNDTKMLARAAREVAWKHGVKPGEVWSEQQVWSAVISNALYNKLRGSYRSQDAEAARTLKQQADENNSYWDEAQS